MSKWSKFRKSPLRYLRDSRYIAPLFFRNLSLEKVTHTLFTADDDRPLALLMNFTGWKHSFIVDFLPEFRLLALKDGFNHPVVLRWLKAHYPLTIICWGQKLPAFAESIFAVDYRMEDGFLRSKELGAKHSRPLSLVLDDMGIYYNCKQPSRLETYLNNHLFTDAERALAERCMDAIRTHGVSKYNCFDAGASLPEAKPGRKRILVIGQVEDDQSILFGTEKPITNNALVRLAAKEHPDAEIWYKIHPDVLARCRPALSDPAEVSHLCTLISQNIRPKDLFAAVDHVYTISSLMGFEALIFGKPVTCVGAPFYANWGLTDDRTFISRRQRRLTLAEVFYGAYIHYPRYAEAGSGFIDCHQAIKRLAS